MSEGDGKVKVTAAESGAVIIVSEANAEYGYIRVVQERAVFDDRGWTKRKLLSALVHGTIEDLKALNWEKGLEIAGKIVMKDSLEPYNNKHPEKDLKVAGKTGIVCMQNGKPIYRKNFYLKNVNAEDHTEPHTNKEDIQKAYAVTAAVKVDETAKEDTTVNALDE